VSEPTTKQRMAFAKAGYAMPDGSYYIRAGAQGVTDLDNAIQAVGRSTGSHDDVRKHIIKRAKDLGRVDMIPDNWNPDGSLKHEDPVEAFLEHFGVRGMHWGHHMPGEPPAFIQRQGQPQPGSQDHQAQVEETMSLLKQLMERTHQDAQESAQTAKASPTPVNQEVHQATAAHAAAIKKTVQAAQSAHAVHKAKKLPKSHSGNSAHAQKMAKAAKHATAAHAAHKAHVAKLKGKHASASKVKKPGEPLTTKEKQALAKLSPAERNALAKLSVAQREVLAKMSPADKKALSKLSQAQKDALAKATAASAKKRHEEAVARKAGSAQHSNLDPVDEFLAHYGVKGMHWGVRRDRGTHGPSSADHQQVVSIGQKINTHGGIHALSNDELETVNKRLNLEQNFHRLTHEPGNIERGRHFVKQITADTKTAIDAVNTGRQVVRTAQGLSEEASKHARRRQRNAPLKVVRIR
jgi:hypothetical protein